MPAEPSAVVWVPGDSPSTTLHAAAAAAGRADLAVVLPGVEPFGDWLERLVAAARSDTTIATASALLSGGRWAPSPLPAAPLAHAAAVVAERSARARPRIGAPHAGCVLLRRPALDLAGIPDEPLSAAAALAEFGERCTALGLSHVLADDVLAAGRPAAPEPGEAAALDARHPHRTAARELDERPESPAEHAAVVASRGLRTLSVTIDARALGPRRAGTQVHALELIAALGRTGRVALRIVTPPDLDPGARAVLEAIDDLTLLPHAAAVAADGRPPATDVVHRPGQVFSAADLALLLPLGHRLVVTHQDLIAYRIPGYHDAVEQWQRYRRITEHALAVADHVVFFSEHARRDALADSLVDPRCASVVPIGVDHRAAAPDGRAPARPPTLPNDDGAPFLLCLGADLPHKNHAFAIALVAALRGGHGWNGRLVHAGPAGDRRRPPRTEDERAVVRLGPVSEEEKAWLLEHAAAVAYPTLYEGFGLIPFEAAAAGTPCLFAPQAALAELLPPGAATLVAWDAAASAAAVAPMLRPGPARDAHVDALRAAGARHRWDDTARALVALYERVLVAPPRELRRAARERLALEQRLAETEERRHEEWRRHLAFRAAIGSDGLGLVGPGGVLAADDQRALLALMSRAPLRRPALRAARTAYRLGLRLRRNG